MNLEPLETPTKTWSQLVAEFPNLRGLREPESKDVAESRSESGDTGTAGEPTPNPSKG